MDPDLEAELDELHQLVKRTRQTTKTLQGQLRMTGRFLARVDERLTAARGLEPPAEEAQTNGSTADETIARV